MMHFRSLAGLAALAATAAAAPAWAATLPPTQGSITFSDFQDASGNAITSCNKTTAGVDSSSCSGLTVYTGGPLGDGFHVSANKSGSGAITSPGGAPTVTTTMSMSGGDQNAGAGNVQVDTRLQYYVTVIPLGAIGTSGLEIPLTFDSSGGVDGTGSNAALFGEASTVLSRFAGDLSVDGGRSGFDDDVSDTVDGGSLALKYALTHQVIFDFAEGGDVIARVNLAATCAAAALKVDVMSADCTAHADPFVGFDQAAFDAMMGAKTFNLSDAFEIVLSSGLEPTGGLPEPASWALMIAGFGLAGSALRAPRRATARPLRVE